MIYYSITQTKETKMFDKLLALSVIAYIAFIFSSPMPDANVEIPTDEIEITFIQE